jgi:hypothetical protein
MGCVLHKLKPAEECFVFSFLNLPPASSDFHCIQNSALLSVAVSTF